MKVPTQVKFVREKTKEKKTKKKRADGEQNRRNKTADNICLLTVAANLSTPECV